MKRPWPAVAVALALLAGCAAQTPPDRTEPASAAARDHLELSGCDGIIVALAGPARLYAGAVPPGWASDQAVNTLHVEVYHCQRLSWGPFERGPIDILQEWHKGFAAPDTCREAGRYDLTFMLQSIWFSDPDVAAYARDVHGMPAGLATFNEPTAQDIGPVGHRTWAWSVPGHPESRVDFEEGAQANRTTDIVQRIYWSNGEGVSYLDDGESFEGKDFSPLASGRLESPLLYARTMPSPEFAAPATRQGHATASATIARFRDTACLEPA